MILRLSIRLLTIVGSLFVASAADTVMLHMRDGVELATDIYKPEGTAAHPVILVRTPYNKNGVAAIGVEGLKRGYVVVAQDCRGRFASKGENLPFHLDGPDGYDTIEWVAKQPWCNGKIGTWGGSAVAITQFQMLTSGTDKISSQHLTVGAPNLYEVTYINGVFRTALVEDWLRIAQWSSNALPAWVAHPTYDRYWRDRDASHSYGKANAPAVHIGGYWDIFAQGTIDSFAGYQKQGGPGAHGKQKLVLGPWAHAVFQEKVGELTFPQAKNPPGSAHDAWKWFDFTLKGETSSISDQPAVTYYVIGDTVDASAPGNVWRSADQWPPVKSIDARYYLGESGTFSRNEPIDSKPLSYFYDPANPAPTIGGIQLSIPAGPMDQKKVESRDDVLVFTSNPLTAPMEVTGRIRARIWVSTDVPDTDIIARLCDVYPDGRSFNLCEGAIRVRFRDSLSEEKPMKPGQIYPLDIDLWSTSVIFNTAHRLRVHITSSSSRGYDPNPNTGAPFRAHSESRRANVKVHIDSEHPSHFVLPVVTP